MSGHNILVKSDLARGLHHLPLVIAIQDPPMQIGLTPISFKTTQRLHIMTRPALRLPGNQSASCNTQFGSSSRYSQTWTSELLKPVRPLPLIIETVAARRWVRQDKTLPSLCLLFATAAATSCRCSLPS